MAIIKCKMCGGDLNLIEDSSVCECEYCGTKQTVPKVDDEKKLKLFARAGKLLRGCEFDKASGVFESIISDFPEEAEAYWGLILCKYGIEYVDDPATGKKVPTCHRSSFESVEDDANFEQACENADAVARRVYREEARQIETLRKRILEVSGKEEPYDIFISYKELDEDGDRTPDSVIAQDIYRTLTKEGYRVFFSRISLEGKLGVEYEPYIFAALNSAKVMIVVGTDYEYFDAVWVKNEWSRFLKLIASGQQKTLIPVYKDMDPYDMPKELRVLAAQNMGKIGAMQDLVRGVEKLLGKKKEMASAPMPTIVATGGPNVSSLLDRGNMALEDEAWEKAKEFFNQVLNMDSRCGEAYLGLVMAERNIENRELFRKAFIRVDSTIHSSKDYDRAVRFADADLSCWLASINSEREKAIRDAEIAKELSLKEEDYQNGLSILADEDQSPERLREAQRLFERLGSYRDAKERANECVELIKAREAQRKEQTARREEAFQNAKKHFEMAKTLAQFREVRDELLSLDDTLDASEYYYVKRCNETIARLTEEEKKERERIEREKEITEGQKNGNEQLFQEACESFSLATELEELKAVQARFKDLKPYRNAECDEFINKCELSISTVQKEKAAEQEKKLLQRASVFCSMIAAGPLYSFAVMTDGTVHVTRCSGDRDEGEGNVESWRNIIAISAGGAHTVGLKADRTVLAVGYNGDGRCNVAKWKDIIEVSAGMHHTVGLKSDGTVVATGNNEYGQCSVSSWTDIIAVAAGWYHTVGLRKNGTVLVVGKGKEKQTSCSFWNNIVAITAGYSFTAGLVADGTVVVSGDDAPRDAKKWNNIIAISADMHLVGLKKDGSVEACLAPSDHHFDYGQINVRGWHNIVGISTSLGHTLGLMSNGTVVSTKEKDSRAAVSGKYATAGWRLFKNADTIEEERENYIAIHKKKMDDLSREREQLVEEYSNLKGIFSIVRRREIDARLAEIEAELKELE